MNRILRPILSMRALCALFSVLFITSLHSQVTIVDCPVAITNIVIQNPTAGNCNERFSLPIYPSSPEGTVTWYSTGANPSGDNMNRASIASFQSIANFSFGLTTVIFVAEDMMGNTAQCETIVFVSEEANLPVTSCDPITVDLAGECTGEVMVPYESVVIVTDICDPTVSDSVEPSWNMDSNAPAQRTIVVNAHDGNPSFYSLYLRKFIDDGFVRQGNCLVQINIENGRQPALVCPASETIFVAPGCTTSYAFDVEAASTPPCMGSIVQTMGDPSGTPLAGGDPALTYDYAFTLTDDDDASNNDMCAFTISVEESALASTQLICIGQLNISIDQNCEAFMTVPTILTGSTCLPTADLLLSANIPGQGEVVNDTLFFSDLNVGQTIEVSVSDPNGLNSCWGLVTIEDKIGPAIVCPMDETILCSTPSDTSATGFPTLVGTGCSDVTINFSDATLDNGCSGAFQSIISRTFIATDGSGNVGPACTQTIFIERETLLSAILPPHWDGLLGNDPLSCDGAGVVYNTITREDGRVVPSPFPDGDLIGTGSPGGVGTCGTIFSFYEDIIIEICEEDCAQSSPSYKVLRTWDIFDWCTSTTLVHQQIIKVVDTIAPVFQTLVPDLTVSTDLWGCGATIFLPNVLAVDNCSSEITYSWGTSAGTYDGATNQIYLSSIALTNIGEEIEIYAYARDCCGNVAVDTGLVTVRDLVPPSIAADEHTVVSLNNQSQDGSTKVKAYTFDDGSFDGCGPIDYWVRRMDKACVDYDGDPDTEIDEVNDFHKEIHFCCMDLEEQQMVVFMVCDDGDRDGVPEMNGDDNCSTAMVLVTVQDKLAPTINCPIDRTINCIDFVAFVDLLDRELTEEDIAKLEANFSTAFSNSTCGIIGNQTFDSGLDEICGVGDVSRTFNVTTTNGTASCTQVISVTGNEDNLLSCDRISFTAGTAEANANYDWCDPADLITPFVVPIQIFECGGVEILEPLIDRDNLCTEVGINLTLDTFNFAGGACVKILAHWEVIDQCFFDENFLFDDEIDPFQNANGYYELYVEYDIFDTDAPDLACVNLTVETTDCDFNYDTFTMNATDDCTADDLISVTYKVDLGNDGTYDIPAAGNFAEGNSFDASTIGGLPIGTHSIKWAAYDGCGNYEVCRQEIEVVKQNKAPTPYCHLGLSSAVMDEQYGCSVEFWATDFAVDGFDDCDDSITVLMIPYQDIYGNPADLDDDLSVEDALGMAMANWTFGCEYIENGISHVVELRIYFVDEDGNFDFCDASLTLNDNFDCCEDLDLGGGDTNVSVTLQPDGNDGKDANIWSNGADGNQGDSDHFNIYTWTNSGIKANKRGLIEFDLTEVPSNAVVNSATLTLYFNPTDAIEGIDAHSGSNDAILEKVTESWDEQIVTWNNQPSTSPDGAVSISAATTDMQNITISVQGLVQEMVSNPDDNFGFLLKMMNEDDPFRMLILATSDHSDSGLHPKLDISYSTSAGGTSLITGNVATDEGEILENVNISVMTDNPDFPRNQSTSNQGSFMFSSLPMNYDYELNALRNSDAKEGVTTLDIVLIQRHILGIAELSSPYKIIAADVNGNEKISAVDLLQLRKLILGIYSNDELPNNTSWRFVDHAYEFPDVKKPFPFVESVNVMNLSHSMYNQNFVGVKIGDVNGSISASIKGDAAKRSQDDVVLLASDVRFEQGEEVSLEITAKDLANLYGMQFALNFDADVLTFENVKSGVLDLGDNNVSISGEQLLLSWNELNLVSIDEDETLFTISFNAKSSGTLSKSLSLDSEVMNAEIYNEKLEALGLILDFRSLELTSFELLQNTPNPFNTATDISFVLPESGVASFRVYDVTGKVIVDQSGNYNRGINTISISNETLGSSGVYYYQLTYLNESASRKMILLD